MVATESRSLGQDSVREARLQRLHEARIDPLTRLIMHLRRERPDVSVPWFDPESGGADARVLLLLEAPGPMAALAPPDSKQSSSGFVSLDNDDATAAALHDLVAGAGVAREELLMWNMVPWYLGDSTHTKIRAATNDDIDEGAVWLEQLVGLLPNLTVAVLLGEKALRGWFRIATRVGRPIPVLACPHPSPRSLNPHPERREIIAATLKAAVEFANV